MRFAKVSLLLLAVSTVFATHAGDSATIRGQAGRFSVAFQDPVDGPTVIEVRELDDATNSYSVSRAALPFAQECAATPTEIRCRKNGRTPLAGATYRRTLDGTPSCPGARSEPRFTCVSGCSNAAPKYLRIEPYEC